MNFNLGADMTTARLLIENMTASSSRQLAVIDREESETLYHREFYSIKKPKSLMKHRVLEKCLWYGADSLCQNHEIFFCCTDA